MLNNTISIRAMSGLRRCRLSETFFEHFNTFLNNSRQVKRKLRRIVLFCYSGCNRYSVCLYSFCVTRVAAAYMIFRLTCSMRDLQPTANPGEGRWLVASFAEEVASLRHQLR